MRKAIRRFLRQAHKDGLRLQYWSFWEIAAHIVRTDNLDFPIKDVADELVAMHIAKEISFE